MCNPSGLAGPQPKHALFGAWRYRDRPLIVFTKLKAWRGRRTIHLLRRAPLIRTGYGASSVRRRERANQTIVIVLFGHVCAPAGHAGRRRLACLASPESPASKHQRAKIIPHKSFRVPSPLQAFRRSDPLVFAGPFPSSRPFRASPARSLPFINSMPEARSFLWYRASFSQPPPDRCPDLFCIFIDSSFATVQWPFQRRARRCDRRINTRQRRRRNPRRKGRGVEFVVCVEDKNRVEHSRLPSLRHGPR